MRTPFLHLCRAAALAAALLGAAIQCNAKEDLEFVQEHLPEVAMDNRYATLPIWSPPDKSARGKSAQGESRRSGFQLQGAWAQSSAGNLSIRGPMSSFAIEQRRDTGTRLGAFAFYDSLSLRADHEARPLQTLFAPQVPIERPVDAEFSNLDGTALDYGAGFYWAQQLHDGWLGRHGWLAGLLWQSVRLRDYRFDYRIAAGPQAGTQGQIDFDTHYDHFVPFVGLELPRSFRDWQLTPHVLFAYPQPRRAIVGHITGPGFDIRGNTAAAGNGKHFGDPSVTVGLTVTYLPAHLSFDIGTLATQALLEPWIHPGIETDLLLSLSWTY